LSLQGILDPFFHKNGSKKLTAATAFDALADAVESYVTPLANEFTEALSLKAVSLIFKWLIVEKALEDPSTPYNPRSVTLDDLKTLLKVAYYGDSLDKLLAKS